MFNFDKDMERVMLAKKKEVLQEFETAKKRILRELYCLKRSVHTDMCEMLADHNRINYQLKQIVDEAKIEINKIVDNYNMIFNEAFESFNNTIDTKMVELEALKDSLSSTVEDAISELESMETTVSNLITQVNEAIAGMITQDEVQTMIDTAMGGIDLSELYQAVEDVRSEIVQSDWAENDSTNKGHVLNRTHYGVGENSVILDSVKLGELSAISAKPTSITSTTTWVLDTGVIYNGDELSMFLIHYQDNSYYLDGQKTDAIIVYRGSSINSTSTTLRDVFIPVTNLIVFGELIDGGTARTKDKPFLMYVDPETKKLFLCVTATLGSVSDMNEMSLSINGVIYTSTKSLNPAYLADSPLPGSVLMASEGQSKWVNLPFVSYTSVEVSNIFEDVATLSDTTQKLTFTSNNEVNFSFVPNEIYYLSAGGTTVQCFAVSSSEVKRMKYLNNTDSLGSSVAKIVNNHLNVYVNSSGNNSPTMGCLNEDYETNGIAIKVQRFTTISHEGKIILSSPSGSKYSLIVDDNGALSTTPYE